MSCESEPGDQRPDAQPKNPWAGRPADDAGASGPEAGHPPRPSLPPPKRKPRAPAPRWRLTALAAGAIGAAIVVGAVLAAAPFWWPRVASVLAGPSDAATQRSADLIARLEQLEAVESSRAQHDQQLDALARRIKDIEDRIESMRQLAASAEGGSEVGALASRLAQIETETSAFGDVARRLSQLETRANDGANAESAAAGGLDKRLSSLNERISQIESGGAAQGDDAAARAAVLALGQLRERVHGGNPFVAELGALAALWPGETAGALDALRAYAATGVPTVEMLKQRFQVAATAALRSDSPPGDGWLDRAGRWVRALIVVRPQAGSLPPGNGAPAIITRAETRLRAGELAAAISELGALAPAVAKPFAAWIEDAKALQAAQNALAALEIQAIARLGRS